MARRHRRFHTLCWATVFPLAFFMASANGKTAYIVHGGGNVGATAGGELATLDLATGAITSLGLPTGFGLTGIAASTTTLYMSTSLHALATTDLSGSLISEHYFFGAGFDPIIDGDRINDLSLSPSGTLYASGRQFTAGVRQETLFTVNPATAELTEIGPLPEDSPFGGFAAIAFASDGTLYSHQTNSPGVFHEINPATGASLNAITGGVPGGALGLGYDSMTDLLYASECCEGTDGSLGERVFSINRVTGVSVQLFDFDDGRRIQDIAFIPEPAACATLMLGSLVLLARRDRDKSDHKSPTQIPQIQTPYFSPTKSRHQIQTPYFSREARTFGP